MKEVHPHTARACPLQPLFAAGEAFIPGMHGRHGAPHAGEIVAGRDNRDTLTALHDALAARHREAGPAYWALRSWAMLEWQPAVVALMSVHHFGFVPRFETMGLTMTGAAVIGYSFAEADVTSGAQEDLIAVAGPALRALAETLLDDLSAVTRIKPVLARRLLADRINGALILMQRSRPGLDNDTVRRYAGQWSGAMGLDGMSGVADVPLDEGRVALAVARRACCLAYRCHDGAYCATCPRLAPEERTRRTREACAAVDA